VDVGDGRLVGRAEGLAVAVATGLAVGLGDGLLVGLGEADGPTVSVVIGPPTQVASRIVPPTAAMN